MIKLIGSKNKHAKTYQAVEADILDLNNLIERDNAGDGSTCLIVDTSEVYVLHDGVWHKL